MEFEVDGQLALPFAEFANLFAAAPDAFFKLGRSVELPGGLRSRTYLKTFRGAYVAKFGSFAELERQRIYVDSLPKTFAAWFPRFLLVRPLKVSADAGLAILELVPGRTLHDILWDSRIGASRRLAALRAVLDKLYELHRYTAAPAHTVRDAGFWLDRIHARLPAHLEPRLLQSIVHALNAVRVRKPSVSSIRASLLHGDAQGGNFLVQDSGAQVEVRFLDPLGGSGEALGDYVYDLSRLFHWTHAAASCFERERSRPRRGRNLTAASRLVPTATQLVRAALTKQSTEFNDAQAPFWFEIYAAFHLTGKLHDFRKGTSQRRLSARITECLGRAHHLLIGDKSCRSFISA